MNICIITPRYPYKDIMEYVFVKKLVDEWAKMGHQCVVMTPYSLTSYWRHIFPYKPEYYIDETVKENPVRVYNPRYISLPKIKLCGMELNSRMISGLIYRQIKRIGFTPDIIYCHFFQSAIPGWYVANKMKKPLFVASGESTINMICPPSSKCTLERFRSDVTGCICVSSKNMEEAVGMGLIDGGKCGIFPNGTDLSVFHKKDKDECRKKLGLKSDDFIVICVGGFVERKGQNRIIEAVKQLNIPKLKLMFVGSGNMPLEHESIIFKGKVNNAELPDYLNAADVFCLPTLAEGCCNAIIEAMACGLPIVSSDLSFNYDVLDSQNAILVNPRDIQAIGIAIQRLYDDIKLRERLSQSSLERSKALSIEQRSKSILSFIDSKSKLN